MATQENSAKQEGPAGSDVFSLKRPFTLESDYLEIGLHVGQITVSFAVAGAPSSALEHPKVRLIHTPGHNRIRSPRLTASGR